MSIASTAEHRALAESIRNWARTATPTAAIRDMEPTPADRPRGAEPAGRAVPEGLVDIGLLSIGVSTAAGGAGGTVVDVAVGVEEAAAQLAHGPVFGCVLAAVLLAKTPNAPAAKELLPQLVDGADPVAVGFATEPLSAQWSADGGLMVDGVAGPVLDADAGTHVLLPALVAGEVVWFVAAADLSGRTVRTEEGLDFSRSIGYVQFDGAVIAPTALLAGLSTSMVRDYAATLASAEAAGVASWCVRTASEYARVREQFGKPIGSFQAVKHLCAEMLVRAEVAAALAWDAARAADEDPGQHELACAVAASSALDAAVDNAKDCVQVLGGTGFTWEHDTHLYLRRAVCSRQLLGGSSHWRRKAAELALAGGRRRLDVDLRAYEDGPAAEATRADVCARVAEIARLSPQQARVRLAEDGYLAPHWPRPYGLAAAPAQQLVIDAELANAGVRRPDLVIGGWAVPTILEHGSQWQRDTFVLPTLRGEITWCQLFSEPEAGSDLAALRTKATPVAGGWRLSGQKVWTSKAREADWAICLARTDADAPKHKGITYFLVDMRADRIESRPLREITGDAGFNEVFLADVFVPDAQVVGEVNDGWRLARITLANERVALAGGSSVGDGVERLLAQVHATGAEADHAVVERVGGLVAQGSAISVLDLRATVRALDGQQQAADASVRKLVGVRHRQAVTETALEYAGTAGAVADVTTAPVQHEFLQSRCLSIAGGSTQVLLNVTAERLLGLPRG